MRRMICAAALMSLLLASLATADEKRKATSENLVGILGASLEKMFDTFGIPDDLRPLRGSSRENDVVVVDYGTYRFNVLTKAVDGVIFRPQWTGETVKGIKIGDGRDAVVKILGEPVEVDKKGTAGGEDLRWEFNEKAVLWLLMDKDGKVDGVQINRKVD